MLQSGVSGSQVRVLNLVAIIVFTTAIISDANEMNDLRFLGAVEGKSYFVEIEQFRNWTEAKNYCIASGMRLATITNSVQKDFLAGVQDDVYFPVGHYWTAAQIKQNYLSHLLFAWDNNGETVDEANLQIIGRTPEFNIDASLLLYTLKDNLQYYAELTLFQHRTLCELPVGAEHKSHNS